MKTLVRSGVLTRRPNALQEAVDESGVAFRERAVTSA
jgi:hypothetical protein